MKALKISFVVSLIATAAVVSIKAAEELLTSPPTTQGTAGSCHVQKHTSDKPSGPVVGSPRELSNRSASAASVSHGDAGGHCPRMNKERASMSCCR
jgi:hypothetical protein